MSPEGPDGYNHKDMDGYPLDHSGTEYNKKKPATYWDWRPDAYFTEDEQVNEHMIVGVDRIMFSWFKGEGCSIEIPNPIRYRQEPNCMVYISYDGNEYHVKETWDMKRVVLTGDTK